MTTTPPRITRRTLLAGLGGVGGALVLGACTNDAKVVSGAGSTAPTTAAGAGNGLASDVNLAPRFDTELYTVTGQPQRLVVSFLDRQGEPPKDLPRTIDFQATRGSTSIGGPITATAHQDGVPIPYYPVVFTPDQPGTYTLSAKAGSATAAATFKVVAPGDNPLLAVGQKMRVTDTPTTSDHRGVNPICTRAGANGPNPCPLHDVNLRDALASGKPVALLISTPAYCQIGICGPVLDLLLEARDRHPAVQFIHAEVYKDPGSGSHDLAPVVDAYGLNYEPALFLAKGDGTVVQRLDSVFDRAEIAAGLDLLA